MHTPRNAFVSTLVTPRSRARLMAALAALAVSTALFVSPAHAANQYYDFSTGTDLTAGAATWDAGTTSAWAGSTTPGTAAPAVWVNGNDAFFQTLGTNTVTLSGTVIANSLTQTGTGTITTISGGTNLLINGGGITNSGNSAFTINSALTLGASQSWNASGSTLTTGGNITVDDTVTTGTTTTLTLTGGQSKTLQTGVISNNATDATKKLAITVNTSGGTTTLSGANTYSGGTTLTTGTLTAQNSGATNVLQALGTGTVTLNGGTLNLRANGSANSTTIITGDGTTGNNVVVGGDTAISVDRVSANTGNTFQFNNLSIGAFTLSLSNNSNSQGLKFAGTTTLTGNATFTTSNGTFFLTLAGPVVESGGSFGFTKNFSAAMTLSGNNTYTGATTMNGGTLTLSGSNTTSTVNLTAGTLNVNNTAAIGSATALALTGGSTFSASVAGITTNNPTISLNGNVNFTNNALNLGTGAVTLNGNNVGVVTSTTNNVTLGGNIGNGTSSTGASSLTKTAQSIGSFTNMGALILNGTNSYTGGTIIQQGQVQFGSAAAVPASGKILLAPQGVNSSNSEGAAAVFNFAFGNTELNKVNTASAGTVGLGAANGSALDFSSAGSNLSNVSLGSQGTNTYSGALTPWTSANNGAYQLGGSGNQSSTVNSGGTLTVSSNLGNSGSVATGLIVDPTFVGFGVSNVTLSGVNSYTGRTTVNTGTLTLSGSLNSNSALTVNNSGTFAFAPTTAATTQTLNGLTTGAGFNSVTTANAANILNLGTVTRGNSKGFVSFTPTGTINVASSGNTNGILGPWAVTGTGTGLQYVTLNGSNNITSYSGATAATAADLSNMSSATTNYSYGAATTLVGNQTGNTLRYTGGATTTALGTNSLTLNGLMNAGSGALTISGTAANPGIVIGSSGALDIVSNTQATNISSVISGTGAVTYGGPSAGNLTLSGTNTYTGGTTLNNGTLTVGSAGALGSGALTLNGGIFQNSGALTTSNDLVFTQGTATTVNSNSANFTLAGAITGTGTMRASDGGTFASLILTGDLSGFGGTIIFNGNNGSGDNFNLGGTNGQTNNLSQATLLGENQGARRFSTNGGTVQVGALGGSMEIINGTTNLQVGALNTNSSFGGRSSGTIGVLTKVGTGTLTMNGSAGFSDGGTVVNNGTLLLDLNGFASATPVNFLASAALTLNGGTLSLQGRATTLQNSSQAFSGTTIAAGASTIKVDNGLGSTGNTVATLAGITRTTTVGTVGGGTVDFVLPSGTQSATNGITTTSTANVLGGIMTQANTNSVAYATVNQTDWAALSGNNIISLASYTTGALSGNSDITTSYTGANSAAANSLRFNTDGQTLTLGTGTQVVTGGVLVTANSNTTGSTITGNTLTTGGGREFVFIDYGKLTVASQLVDNVGGSTMLTKSGTGLLTLSNANNTYSGINYLNDGILNIAATGSLGTNVATNAISFNGGTLQLGAAADLSAKGINLGFKGGTIDTNTYDSTYSGVIASSSAVQGTTSENTAGQFGFTKAGTGTLTLTGTNTYAGATTITGGTLSVSYLDNATASGNVTPTAAGGIGKSANYAKNLVLNGGTLKYTGAVVSTDRLFTLGDNGGGLDASGSGTLNFTNTGAVGYQINSTGAATNSSPTLTLGGSSTGTLAALIGNNGLGTTSLTKNGAGSWVLTGANTYTGGTTVNAGTLNFGNSFTMSGANVIAIAAAGAAGTNYATVTSTSGTLTFGGTLGINISASLAGGESFSLFQSSGGALAGNFSSVSIAGSYIASLSNSGGTWTGSANGLNFTFASASGILSVASAIPEPATYAAIFGALALAGAAAYRRRQTHRSR